MNVGYKLYREVRDFAPGDWTPSERLVAWIIADDARDDTRASWIPLALLCQRAGLGRSRVRECLSMLGSRGFEFRVIHGYGRDGRPVFATRNHAVDYLIPDMVKGAAFPAALPVDNSVKGAGDPAAFAGERRRESTLKAPGIGLKGAGYPAPHTSVPSISTSTKEADVSYSNVEGSQLAAEIRTPIESNGHLPIELAALRAALARRQHQETR